jgi:aspartyl-tRNA(Asn)/glutamyl-tRNA(Gln) amidotransferase subunit A
MLGANFLLNTIAGGYLTADDYLRAQKGRRLIAAELKKTFESVDLLLMPTNPRPGLGATFEKGGSDPRVAKSGLAYVTPFNVNGSPAISVPFGFNPAGLPVGLQIGGRPYEDGLVLAAAHGFQSRTDWHRRVPKLKEDFQ